MSFMGDRFDRLANVHREKAPEDDCDRFGGDQERLENTETVKTEEGILMVPYLASVNPTAQTD